MAGLVVLEKMVMLVLLMLVGFLAAKGKWVDESFGQKASFLVAKGEIFDEELVLP